MASACPDNTTLPVINHNMEPAYAPGISVLGWPAFCNAKHNPYNASLYRALLRLGVQVEEFSCWRALKQRYDVVHLHWPEHLYTRIGSRYFSPAGRVLPLVLLLPALLLRLLKLKGTKIIWTVHNIRPHGADPARPWRPYAWFFGLADGLCYLSRASANAVEAVYPNAVDKPRFITPHGTYENVYPNIVSRRIARGILGIPPHVTLVVFFGSIKGYKNVPALLKVLRSLNDASVHLLVAGHPESQQLENEINALGKGIPQIHLYLKYIPDAEVQTYLNAADVCVLPYRETLNSGAARLALSFGVPVACPRMGSFAELAAQVGDSWLTTYAGVFDDDCLRRIVEWARVRRSDGPNLSAMQWDVIAGQTLAAYKQITNNGLH